MQQDAFIRNYLLTYVPSISKERRYRQLFFERTDQGAGILFVTLLSSLGYSRAGNTHLCVWVPDIVDIKEDPEYPSGVVG